MSSLESRRPLLDIEMGREWGARRRITVALRSLSRPLAYVLALTLLWVVMWVIGPEVPSVTDAPLESGGRRVQPQHPFGAPPAGAVSPTLDGPRDYFKPRWRVLVFANQRLESLARLGRSLQLAHVNESVSISFLLEANQPRAV